MRLRTFSFNRGLWIQNLRNFGWIGIIHLVALLLVLPLHALMLYSNRLTEDMIQWENIFQISWELQLVIIFTIPTLLSVFSFRYMQDKLTSDFIHSLPIRRESLFHQQLLFGICMLAIPVLIVSLVFWIVHYSLGLERFFAAGEIGSWVGYTLLFELFVFLVGVFVGTQTGMSTLQAILLYILLILPTGFSILILENLDYFVFGFSADYYIHRYVTENLIPFIHATELDYRAFQTIEIIIYIVLTIVFYLLAWRAYVRRDVEVASQAVAFKVMRPIFKYSVAVCATLIGGFVYGQFQNSFTWTVFGYLIGSFIGYHVAEMILEKTWRVFHKWRGYITYLAIMVVVGTIIKFDITGFENRKPHLEDIKSVYFGEFLIDDQEEISPDRPYGSVEKGVIYESKSTVKKLYLFHQQIISDKEKLEKRLADTRQVVFRYELKNGKRLVRQYRIPEEMYQQFFNELFQSNSFKHEFYPIFQKEAEASLERISISSHTHKGDRTTVIGEAVQREAFLAVLKQELLSETAEQAFDRRLPWGFITLQYDNGSELNILWKKSYSKIDKWLKENGFTNARITAEDIDHAIIIWNTNRFPYHDALNYRDGKNNVILKDKELIELSLTSSSQHYEEFPDYIVAYYFKGESQPYYEIFDEENVPQVIKERFKD